MTLQAIAQTSNNAQVSGAIKLKVLQLIDNATANAAVKLDTIEKHINVKGGSLPITHYLDSLAIDGYVLTTRRRQDDVTTHWYWPTAKGREATTETFGLVASNISTISHPQATEIQQFTIAEKSMIKKVHGYMPAQQLLNILNERLEADKGSDVSLYTMAQLYAEIGEGSSAAPAGGYDWASLRKLLGKAQRDGVLDLITEQTINDFAIVYSLNHKQVLVLKDIVLQAQEE